MTDHITYTEPCKALRRPHWKASMGDIGATGNTKTEAREVLMAKVHAAVAGVYTPTMIFPRERVALIWREQNGWHYTVREVGRSGLIDSALQSLGGDREEKIVARAARKRLADYVMDDEVGKVKDKGGILYFNDEFFLEMLLT